MSASSLSSIASWLSNVFHLWNKLGVSVFNKWDASHGWYWGTVRIPFWDCNVRSFKSRFYQHTMFHVSIRILLRHDHKVNHESMLRQFLCHDQLVQTNYSFCTLISALYVLHDSAQIEFITHGPHILIWVSSIRSQTSLDHSVIWLLVILSLLITSLARFLCQPQKIRNYPLHSLVDISCYVSAST